MPAPPFPRRPVVRVRGWFQPSRAPFRGLGHARAVFGPLGFEPFADHGAGELVDERGQARRPSLGPVRVGAVPVVESADGAYRQVAHDLVRGPCPVAAQLPAHARPVVLQRGVEPECGLVGDAGVHEPGPGLVPVVLEPFEGFQVRGVGEAADQCVRQRFIAFPHGQNLPGCSRRSVCRRRLAVVVDGARPSATARVEVTVSPLAFSLSAHASHSSGSKPAVVL